MKAIFRSGVVAHTHGGLPAYFTKTVHSDHASQATTRTKYTIKVEYIAHTLL